MFVYKKLKASDVSITPSEAHKQYSYDSSSAGTNGLTFNTALWTSESKAHYSSNNLAGNFQNHRKYFQLDKIFYRDYITDNANLIPDVNYIKQERRLYDKVNILSIPQNLFGSRIHPTTFNLTGSFNNGNTSIGIVDDGLGNIYPTTYTLGNTNWPSEKGRLVYIGPVKGFKKKDLTVDNETGNQIVNSDSTFTLNNVYDDSYYLNQVDYNNVTFEGDTPLLGLNFDSVKGGYLRLDHSELYNFGFNDDFNISFYLDYNPTELYNELAGFSPDSDRYRRVIAKADVKTIIPTPEEGRSETLSTFTSGNLQPVDVPAEDKFPFKIELDLRASINKGSGSLSFSRSTGTEIVTITDPIAIFTDPGGSELGTLSKLVHISCQKNGDLLEIYRNGIKVASGSDLNPNLCKGIPPTNEANVYVGMKPTLSNDGETYSQDYGTNFLSGTGEKDIKLSQLMVWDSALSETQIQNVSESITGTPYIGNIFYDEGFVTINHPSYSDILQQYSSSNQSITLNPTYGDENNFDVVVNVTDAEAFKTNVTAFNQEQKIFSSDYSELLLGGNVNKITIPGGSATGSLLQTTNFDYILTANETEQIWNGTIKIENVSSSFITYSLDSDTAANNPFTPSGSTVGFVDKGSYLFLSSSTTTNTQNVTLVINSSSLFFEDFILGGGPGASAHNNISETKFSFASDNDGGVAGFNFTSGPSTGVMRIFGENNQIHLYDGIGPFKTNASTQNIGSSFETITFNSNFSFTPFAGVGGTPQIISQPGLVADFSNNRLEVADYIDQAIHDGTQIFIQAGITVGPHGVGGFQQDIDVQLQRSTNNGSSWSTIKTGTFLSNPIVDQSFTMISGPWDPEQGYLYRLRARSNSVGLGVDSSDVKGGTVSAPLTFLRGINQTVDPGFKNFGAVESETWTTTAEGYYKVRIENLRTDNDNYGGDPDEPLNKGANPDMTNPTLGVAIQILKNNSPIHCTIIPKDTNYGIFEHDFIEDSIGGTYKIRVYVCKDDATLNPPLTAFASNEGFQMGKTTVVGRDKTNTFTINPGLTNEFKTISPGNINNSSFNFDDSAGLSPDSTIIQTITSPGGSSSTITLSNQYTITSSIGATASYEDQSIVSASAELSISESAVYILKDFELGVDETNGLSTLQPRLRINTNIGGNITEYGPYVGPQNVPDINFGVLTGSDSINMDLDIVQNFGSVGSPNYIVTATGDGVGYSIDNLNIDAIFPTSSITKVTGPSFPSTIDSINFFSAHNFNEGDPRLPFTTGSITKNVTYINSNTLKLSEELFITSSTTANGTKTLGTVPISASLLIPAKSKTIYNRFLFDIGGFLPGSQANIAVKLLDPSGTTITSSLYPSNTISPLQFALNDFTSSANGNFNLSIYSSDSSFNPVDVTGSNEATSDYIGVKGIVSSSITSGSYIITKTSGDNFVSNTISVALTSSHVNGGQFPGGSNFASFTTGNLDLNVSEFISVEKIRTNQILFITQSSPSTGSVNLGNQYFLATSSVQNIGDSLDNPLLEGNFNYDNTNYNLTSVNGEYLTLDQNILVTTPTTLTLNYHTTASNDFTVNFKNSHLIFEHEYQCSIDEEEYNFTQNISVRKNKSNQSTDLVDCITGSIDNSQVTLFKPYVTTVGLYDDDYNLLAVGKLAQPVKTSEETDMTFIIRWDT